MLKRKPCLPVSPDRDEGKVLAVTVVVFGGGGRVPRGAVALTRTGFGVAAAFL